MVFHSWGKGTSMTKSIVGTFLWGAKANASPWRPWHLWNSRHGKQKMRSMNFIPLFYIIFRNVYIYILIYFGNFKGFFFGDFPFQMILPQWVPLQLVSILLSNMPTETSTRKHDKELNTALRNEQQQNGKWMLKPMHNIGKVSVNASILYKNQEICNKTNLWKFQLISLFLLQENSKNAFSIFVFILVAGVFVSWDENSLLDLISLIIRKR